MKTMRLLFPILAICIFIISISNVSAVYYFQTRGFRNDNVTTYIWASVTYDTTVLPPMDSPIQPVWYNPINLFNLLFNPPALTQDQQFEVIDQIKSGNPFTSYINYNTYIDVWNTENPNNTIQYCQLTVRYSASTQNGNTIIFQQNFTKSISNGKYFVKLKKGDSYFSEMQCKFNQPSQRLLDIPADFTIITPTWECQACQYYNWNQQQIQIDKAVILGDYTTTILSYIVQLASQFYSLLIVAWWILLILLIISAVGLIFAGAIWLYKLIARHTR